jgi:gliding motility-associated-like protein
MDPTGIQKMIMKKLVLSFLLLLNFPLYGANEPANPPKNSTVSNITCTSARVCCQNATGGAQGYLYVMREATNAISLPTDGSIYSSFSGTFGSNSNLGNSNYVVGIAALNATCFTVTGLKENTKYYVTYYSFNGFPTPTNYLTSSYLVDSFTTGTIKYDFTITKSDSCEKTNSFTFTNKSTSTFGATFTVWFGDGSSTGNFTSTTHHYNKFGNFSTFVTASPLNGCSASSGNKTVTVIPSPTASITLLTPPVQCITNNLFKFDNTTTFGIMPSCALTQSWYFTLVDSVTTPKSEFSYPTPGFHKVSLFSRIYYNNIMTGCWDTTSTYVNVIDVPRFNLGKDDTLCDGANRVLMVPSLGAVKWDDFSTSTTRNITSSGTYWAEIDNGYCTHRDSIWFDVMSSPSIPDLFDSSLCNGLKIKLGVPQGAYTISWSTGEKTDSIQVSKTGAYTVSAKNFCGTVSKTSNIIFKGCTADLFVPDAFTPGNKDGRNDLFTFYGDDIFVDDVVIFNRWGQKVFKTTTGQPWDGTYMNKPCPEGYYSYLISYRHVIGSEVKLYYKSGMILLLQ